MHPLEGSRKSNEASEVQSNETVGHRNVSIIETDFFTDGVATNDGQDDQNSGWFEVKKKSRSSTKSSTHKSTPISKKPVEPPGKAKVYSGQNGREESKVSLPSMEQQKPSSDLKEQVPSKSKDLDSDQDAKDAARCTLTDMDKMQSLCVSASTDNMVQLAKGPRELSGHQFSSKPVDAPKFKWGDLDDEDLTQNRLVEDRSEKGAKSLPINHYQHVMTKSEDSTICLEGGKQSSTKEINGIKSEDTGKTLSDYPHTLDVTALYGTPESSYASHASSFIASSEKGDHTNDDFGEGFAKSLALSTAEDSNATMALCLDEVHPSTDAVGSSTKLCAKQPMVSESGMVSMASSNVVSESSLKITSGLNPEKKNVMDGLDSVGRQFIECQQAVQGVLGSSEGSEGEGAANKRSMEFSVAASMLMGKFEETKSGESKERFRQRLWCYLFENLNRAIDELYFLCELECDMEQIQEALLVLKEAGLDFSELKSRVEGFEKVKKHPGTSQILFGGNLGAAFPGKVEHRRPHAIAWEVRRMACSPHRAEILSSSLQAFKKVQQITAQKNLVSQSKRREAAKLLDIEQSCAEFPSKILPSTNSSSYIKEAASKVEDKQKSLTKANRLSVSTTQNGGEIHFEVIKGSKELCGSDSNGQATGSASSIRKACSTAATLDLSSSNAKGEVTDGVIPEKVASSVSKAEKGPVIAVNVERSNKSTEKRVSIVDNQREKKTPKTRSSMDAWKVKRNWEDVLSSPMKSLNRASRSPCTGWKSTERVKVLHDKLMSPERKRKSPLEMKKEVDEKQARATRIRRELENERVQRLQRTTEKLNRVSEWQAVRSNKLREGMHARQQRGESRHEAHLAEIARRASDESSKVSEVRFITSLNEENKKLSLRQKLQDSELRRAERLQIIKTKQKEDVAREEAVLERRRIIEAERLQRLAEAQRKKEEAKARRDEERKAASAAREARAVEQVRKKEVRAKAQQEVTELQAQKLTEKLRESELRRKVYLEQIRERAAMESREQASPSTRLSLTRDGQPRSVSNQGICENDGSIDKETVITRQVSGNKGTPGLGPGVPSLKSVKVALQHQALRKRVKKIRQRLMAKKYEFMEPPTGTESSGIGSMAVAAAARSKIGRWLQDLQRFQLARKAGTSGVGFIVGEMIKYFDGKEAELHAARQAGLVDFIATALPASHTSKAEASQTTLSLLRILKVLLALPANRSYFISRNLLPPLIPMLSTALENFSSQDSVSVTSGTANAGSLCGTADKLPNDEKLDAVGEVLNGLLECVTLIMKHSGTDERQVSMKDDLVELLIACEVIHHLRDLFSLFDRPQIEGAPFPTPVLFGLNLLQALTGPRGKLAGLPYDAQLNMMLDRREAGGASCFIGFNAQGCAVSSTVLPQNEVALVESVQPSLNTRGEIKAKKHPSSENEDQLEEGSHAAGEGRDRVCTAVDVIIADKSEVSPGKHAVEELLNEGVVEASQTGETLKKSMDAVEQMSGTSQEVLGAEVKTTDLYSEKGQMRQSSLPACRSISNLVSAIAETGLVGLPSLLTAVLLQTNPRSTPEQAAAVLPSNFEEVATCVLKVLNNLARLDLGLVQSLLAMPDLQMEFFHLVSFLLSHCTCKWNNSTDRVASLLLETLLLLGYFALLHPGNQAVLRWGKSPTILHKICDLPFAFFSDPLLMPVLVGTLLAICYGSEQNRDVVREELSMDMLLSLLKSSRTEVLIDKDRTMEDAQAVNEPNLIVNQSSQINAASKEGMAEIPLVQVEDSIPAKEEIKRMIEDTTGSDSETNSNIRQQAVSRLSFGRSSSSDFMPSPGRRLSKAAPKAGATTEGEPFSGKEIMGARGSMSKNHVRGNTLSASTENASSQSRKVKGCNPNTGPVSNKRQPVTGCHDHQVCVDCASISADPSEPYVCLRPDLMLQNRFPACLLDMAQDFFSAVL